MDNPVTGNSAFLAIDVGGTTLKSAILSSEGEVLEGSRLSVSAHSAGSREQILGSFRETVIHGLRIADGARLTVQGIGAAFPGPFDHFRGIPLMKHKFLGIHGLDMGSYFREIPGVRPDIPVHFLHDAHAVLAGELWKGNAAGYLDTAVITLGTGLGFAYSKSGVIQCNQLGGPRLSIYNLPFRDGNLEGYTARSGFLRIYKEISGENTDGIEVSDLGRWADQGDVDSIRTFREVGSILAEVLGNILVEKGIQCLLFGGQISRSFQHLEQSLKEGLTGVECLHRISPVKHIETAPLLGALRAILDENDLFYSSD
jgi:glucokinase